MVDKNTMRQIAVERLNEAIQNAKTISEECKVANFSICKVSVLGAGMMGAGIAFEVAKAGVEVCLKDTMVALAEKGKSYAEKCCNKLIALGKMNETEKEDLLARISPSENVTDFANSDIIIEAVFEDLDLKNKVIKESAMYLQADGFFASNTTSLPISILAESSNKGENFIGLHFFSPVDRMPLVEIIMGKNTHTETLHKALQFVVKMGKVPIVVHDSPAFFTSRIFFNYLLEAVTMLLEGIPAASIEEAAMQAGFAVSPLAVLDEISIPLMLHVYKQLPQLNESQKRCFQYLERLVNSGRVGRKSGKGFYDYDTTANTKTIWTDTSIIAATKRLDASIISKRLLHVMALDSYRCLDEGVLDKPIDGDIGSILGVGFAKETGGVFAYIDQVGVAQFVKDCDQFSDFGEQWNVPASLKKQADEHCSFYDY